MDKTLNPFLYLDKDAKIGHVGYFSSHQGANRIFFYCCLPWIRFKLFDAKRKTLIFSVNLKHHRLNSLAF